jgi:hypothetical protein
MIVHGYCTLGVERETAWSRAEQLSAMDRAGVGLSVIDKLPLDQAQRRAMPEKNPRRLFGLAGVASFSN